MAFPPSPAGSWTSSYQSEGIRAPDLNLLLQSTEALLDIAKFYVGGHQQAVRARKKAERRSRGRPGQESFHATLVSRLASLETLLLQGLEKYPLEDVDLRHVVEITLQTFEDLTEQPENSQYLDYPGLHGLLEQHSLHRDEEERLLSLDYRLCLYCPSLDSQDRLKAQLRRCYEALAGATSVASTRTKMDPNAILADTEALQEWRPPSNFIVESERLHRVLSKHLRCRCGTVHEGVKVSPLARRTGALGAYQYPLCFPVTAMAQHICHFTQLQLIEQHASERSGHAKPRLNEYLTPPPGQASYQPRDMNTICAAFRGSTKTHKLLVDETRLQAVHSRSHDQHNSQLHLTSLNSSTFADSSALNQFSKKDRVVLAVVLAYIYLYLNDTAWWPVQRVIPDLWFTQATTTQHLEVKMPFIGINVNQTGSDGIFSVESFMNDQRPSLPAFGKLLLEIWKGATIEWKDLDATIQECRDDFIGSYWLCAVHACLGDDASLKEKGSLRESPRLRNTFVHKVVKSLQWLLENLCRLSVDDIFAGSANVAKGSGQVRNQSNETDNPTAVLNRPVRSMPASSGPKRLINTKTLEMEEMSGLDTWPPYAILSHRWTMAEVTYPEYSTTARTDKLGWSKVQGACRQARKDGIPYVWVDSCCIDKSVSTELSEALNSMYRWYNESKICYVHLSDVKGDCIVRDVDGPYEVGSLGHRVVKNMKQSQWFKRGWTLQELLAPCLVRFFGAGWELIGDLSQMTNTISRITGIDVDVLQQKKSITDYSVAQRFSWAAQRTTAREEDEAYSLLGIFGVSLEARYGIGRLAFEELQRKILDSGKADDSLFTWNSIEVSRQGRFFATSPADFADCANIVSIRPRPLKTHLSCRSDGMGGRLGLYCGEEHLDGWTGTAAVLNCTRNGQRGALLGLRLRAIPGTYHAGEVPDYVVAASAQVPSLGSHRLVAIDRRRLLSVAFQETTIALEPE